MDEHQLTKMMTVEAFTYALSSKLFYDYLITTHFSYATYSFPVTPISIILLFVLVSTITRIRNTVTETINEL